MGLARFLQLSDLHLGRPFGWLPPDSRDERRGDQRRALEHAVTQAIERDVHAILIPGDLFDLEGVDSDTMAFAIGSAFDVAGCPPVFIAPGNHDPYFEGSLYWNPRRLAARGLKWPDHVHVFSNATWSAAPLPTLEGVRVWGRCFTANVPSLERPLETAALARVSAANPTGFDVAVFHGSREGHVPAGAEADRAVLRRRGAARAVRLPRRRPLPPGVAHRRQRRRLRRRAARLRRLRGRDRHHRGRRARGARGAGRVRHHRRPFVEIELVELDRRKVYDLTADVTGCTSAERVDRRIQKALDDAGVTDRDIVTVRLTGRLARGVRYAAPGRRTWRRASSTCGSTAARCARTTTSRRCRLRRPHHRGDASRAPCCEERDRETDPVQRALIESALYYGLDAFRLREVVPAWEELEA